MKRLTLMALALLVVGCGEDGGIPSLPAHTSELQDASEPTSTALTDISGTVLLLDFEDSSYFPGESRGSTLSDDSATGDHSAQVQDGTSVKIPDGSHFAFGVQDFSVEVRIKTTDSSTFAYVFGQVPESCTLAESSVTIVLAQGKVRTSMNIDSVGSYSMISDIEVNDGQWHEIVLQRRSGTFELIIDGSVEKTKAVAGSIYDNSERSTPTALGAPGDCPTNHYTGLIDGFRIMHGTTLY